MECIYLSIYQVTPAEKVGGEAGAAVMKAAIAASVAEIAGPPPYGAFAELSPEVLQAKSVMYCNAHPLTMTPAHAQLDSFRVFSCPSAMGHSGSSGTWRQSEGFSGLARAIAHGSLSNCEHRPAVRVAREAGARA